MMTKQVGDPPRFPSLPLQRGAGAPPPPQLRFGTEVGKDESRNQPDPRQAKPFLLPPSPFLSASSSPSLPARQSSWCFRELPCLAAYLSASFCPHPAASLAPASLIENALCKLLRVLTRPAGGFLPVLLHFLTYLLHAVVLEQQYPGLALGEALSQLWLRSRLCRDPPKKPLLEPMAWEPYLPLAMASAFWAVRGRCLTPPPPP